jgi:hypothetical protein
MEGVEECPISKWATMYNCACECREVAEAGTFPNLER